MPQVEWTTDGTTLTWQPVSAGLNPLYSLIRGKILEMYVDRSVVGAVCIIKDSTSLQKTIAAIPNVNEAFYFLVGAENSCRTFPTYGFDRDGVQARLNFACDPLL